MKPRLLILCAFYALLSAAPASAEVLVRGKTIDSGTGVQRLGGFGVSRDGSGAVVYLKSVDGEDHVFSSRLTSGAWSAPQQLDGGLTGSSSAPAVTVGDGGLVLVAFVNAGRLITVNRPSAASPWSAPRVLFAGPVGSGPSLDLSIRNKAYLTFASNAGGNSDVRVASFRSGAWSLTPAPLDAEPTSDAGAGTGRPRISSAGSGLAIVVWGERGGVYARRVWDAQPSTSVARADLPSLGGDISQGADSPEVASPYDDSYAQVAYRQSFAPPGGGPATSRVILTRLRGGQFESPPILADGNPPAGSDGAAAPRLVGNGSGFGLLATTRQSSHQAYSQLLRRRDPVMRLDSGTSNAPAFPVVALSGNTQGLVAYQHDDGTPAPEIRGRRALLSGAGELSGGAYAPEQTLSDPVDGPAQADRGLEASADGRGDLLVAYAQGLDAARRISVSYYDAAPGGFTITSGERFQNSARPLLTWSQAADLLDPVSYEVALDEANAFTVRGLAARPPAPLSDGVHTLGVTAIDSLGQRTPTGQRLVKVDTRPPRVRVSVRGPRQAGRNLRFTVGATDPPAVFGTPTSGVAKVIIAFGDRTPRRVVHRSILRPYARTGTYRVLVTVLDRAGNVTRRSTVVRIAKPAASRR